MKSKKVNTGIRCRPHDKGIRRMFFMLCDFLDDLQFRFPQLYKVKPMIEFVYNKGGKNLVGVEIGTFRGVNAYSILNFLPIKKLYLIDPYLRYKGYIEVWLPEHSQQDFNKDYEITKKRLRRFKDKFQILKMKSIEAIDLIPDKLDFVYIDGNHAYEYVKKDIELYFPKLKFGGVLGGDNFEVEFHSVPRAVLEFVDKMNLKLYGSDKDWWIIK